MQTSLREILLDSIDLFCDVDPVFYPNTFYLQELFSSI
jgi:hypothetical protein